MLLAAGVLWLLGPSLIGARVLSANDMFYTGAPFAGTASAKVSRPSNPYLTDPVYVFHPQMQKAREAVRDGRLPLWDPNIGAGRPLLAAQLSAPLYPLTWLSFALPFWLSVAWIAAFRILLAGAGTWLLCRRLGLSPAAAAVGAVAFGFGSPLLLAVEAPTANIYALLPWLLLLVDRVMEHRRSGDAALLGVVFGLTLLGGHPESAFVTGAAVAAYALYRIASQRAVRQVSGKMAIAVGVALGVGAVSVIPFLELLRHSGDLYRGSPRLPARLFTESLFFPDRWGRPDKVEFAVSASAYAGRGVYFGSPALLLAIAGLSVRRSRDQLFFLALVVVSFLLLADLPLATAVVKHTPLLKTMRTDYFLWPATFGCAMLAAFGAHRVQTASAEQRKRMIVVVALAALLPLAWALLRHGHLGKLGAALAQQPVMGADAASAAVTELAAYIRWAGIALITLVVLIAGARLRRPGLTVAVLACVLLLDLGSLGHGYHPQISKAIADPPTPNAIRYLQGTHDHQRFVAELGALGPNLSDRYGIYDMDAFSPPVIQRYGSLYEPLGQLVVNLGRTRVDIGTPVGRSLMDMFATRYVIGTTQPTTAESGLSGAYSSDGQRVLLNPTALPRAWVAYGWRTAAGREPARDAVIGSSADQLENTPVIEGVPVGGSRTPATPAAVTLDGDTRVMLDVDAARPGFVVLTDTYYPGWKASVDGHAADIKPANVAFRAVRVPAGKHVVSFRYRPLSFLIGGAISAIALLITVALLVVDDRRRRA